MKIADYRRSLIRSNLGASGRDPLRQRAMAREPWAYPRTEFDRRFTGLKPEQAAYVRRLRVDEGRSWRGVAWACAQAWGGDWEHNQLAGMALCERAAAMLGEDPNAEPWN